MDDSIFKSYDVRGIYPETINEEVAEKIGMAFVGHFKLKKVAVGRDGRISSPQLETAIILGIKKMGADVIKIGIISTDMLYFASAYYDDIDGGAIITASHNPKDNNGFKFILKGAVAVSGEEGGYAMRDLIKENKLQIASELGKEESRDIYADYTKKLQSLIETSKLESLKVVIDAGNGVGGFVFEKAISGLSIEYIPLYCEIDGNFPNHQPSPIEDKNLVDIKKKVIDEGADIGLAFDGDGDRVYLIDEKGEAVDATVMTAMIAKRMLDRNPGAKILYNVNVGWIVPEIVEKMGGVPSITKVGHSLIKAQMRKEDGLFAGEHSGHYFFKDLYYADSGMLAALIVLELMSEDGRKLSEIVKEYDIYSLSGEINTDVSDPLKKIEEIKEKYSDGKISELDGLSVEYLDWRFILRPSNTEPLLRLNVEAKTKELMETKRDELLEIIRA
ncbi:MAG: phosphomannomutase/phosphoglucomutase [Candidatus Berkelbacteria bacterium]|nr:phosphomannomutase/phosphoglucomutase [Candidatus Berkelbacteria bacterium]